MVDAEIDKELSCLAGERRLLGEELNARRSSIARELTEGSMGKDIEEVLSGKRKVELPHQVVRRNKWWRRILEFFIQDKDEYDVGY